MGCARLSLPCTSQDQAVWYVDCARQRLHPVVIHGYGKHTLRAMCEQSYLLQFLGQAGPKPRRSLGGGSLSRLRWQRGTLWRKRPIGLQLSTMAFFNVA